jgi:hypothetical protein
MVGVMNSSISPFGETRRTDPFQLRAIQRFPSLSAAISSG